MDASHSHLFFPSVVVCLSSLLATKRDLEASGNSTLLSSEIQSLRSHCSAFSVHIVAKIEREEIKGRREARKVRMSNGELTLVDMRSKIFQTATMLAIWQSLPRRKDFPSGQPTGRMVLKGGVTPRRGSLLQDVTRVRAPDLLQKHPEVSATWCGTYLEKFTVLEVWG